MEGLTKRTTLTLPATVLSRVEAIAASRHVTMSTVISEALEDGLEMQDRASRGDEILDLWKRAFDGLSEEEELIASGYDMEPVPAAK